MYVRVLHTNSNLIISIMRVTIHSFKKSFLSFFLCDSFSSHYSIIFYVYFTSENLNANDIPKIKIIHFLTSIFRYIIIRKRGDIPFHNFYNLHLFASLLNFCNFVSFLFLCAKLCCMHSMEKIFFFTNLPNFGLTFFFK